MKKEKGMSLNDAFADDEDVVYSESKPRKKEKKQEREEVGQGKVIIKNSKPIEKIKKGDKIFVDGKELEVDAHIVLIDHKDTKEMAIECFDKKTDKDYQIRYFENRLDISDPEFYELQNDFMYVKKVMNKLEF